MKMSIECNHSEILVATSNLTIHFKMDLQATEFIFGLKIIFIQEITNLRINGYDLFNIYMVFIKNVIFNQTNKDQNSKSLSLYIAHTNLLSRVLGKINSIFTSFFLHQATEILGSL